MEYIKSSQNWECDSHDSSKALYPAEIDEVITKDSSQNKPMNSICSNLSKMGSTKKLLSAVEPSEEILKLLAKARDDLRKQEATKAREIMSKEELIEAKQSAFPDNFQFVAEHTRQFDEREISRNKSVDNIFEKALASKTPNFVECNQQKQRESLESLLQIDAEGVPFQAAKFYERKPFTRKYWFEHDDRDREEVEEAAAKPFEGYMKSIQNKSSCEAVNRWGHDLYDASLVKANGDEFPGYSKKLFPRPISKCETVDRWGHDLYDATQQNPKNDQEFSDFYLYGGDRRQVNSRGPSKYRSSFQEGAEFACSRPFRGRGAQPHSEDRMNTKAAAKPFEGDMKSIQNKSSCEAVNRWGHDLYDASLVKANGDEFPGYSKKLFPRPISKCETVDRWGHDLYDATQQTPKNEQEFSDFYGGDRRQVNSRGSSKYRSSFQESAEFASSRPFRGRGAQPRSEDRMNTKKDEMSAINRDMENFYL